MKSNKKITLVLGSALFVSIVLTFALLKKPNSPQQDISFVEALTKIKQKEATEATIRQDKLELTGKTNEKFTAKLDSSDSARDQIYAAATETGTIIKLEPASSGWGWLLILNLLPFVMMSAVTLAAIVYVVKTLTKNKG